MWYIFLVRNPPNCVLAPKDTIYLYSCILHSKINYIQLSFNKKYLKQAPSYTVTFRNNRYLYLSKMQPLHHKKYVSMNIILSQRIYFVIINSETQICKIKVTIENKSLNMKIKKVLKGQSKNLSRAHLLTHKMGKMRYLMKSF